jgi:hypothetical protein
MNIFSTTVPTWVSILFALAFPISVLLIAQVAKDGAIRAVWGYRRAMKIYWKVVAFCSIFLIYTAIMSFTGIFQVNSIPPRTFLFTTIPLYIFYLTVVRRSDVYKALVEITPLESLIRLHIFRLLGSVFIIMYLYGALPKTFALLGGIGDLFAAISSIFVANAVRNRTSYSLKLAFVWNIVGIWDIVNVIIAAVVTTRFSIAEGAQGILEITKFPFSWIPAFAPATIIFLHITIFKKLKMVKNEVSKSTPQYF